MELTPGKAFVLALDGTLVFVEEIQPHYAGVVALPEQVTPRPSGCAFTPGRVGLKKISPLVKAEREVPLDTLSVGNSEWLAVYKTLRDEKGANHVHPEPPAEEKPVAVFKAGPRKEKKEKRERGLRARCETCGQQPGHPNHPGDHAFVAPAADAAGDAPEPEKPKREKKEKPARTPRASGPDPNARYRWVGTDDQITVLAGGNPKYKPNNSGFAIIEAIKAGHETAEAVCVALATGDKWKGVPPDRVAVAFKQLLACKMIEVIP